MTCLTIVAVALLVDAVFGYPNAVFRAIRHPVVWMGALVLWLDRRCNRPPRRRARGVLAEAVLLIAVLVPAALLQIVLLRVLPLPSAVALLGLLTASLPAQRSLDRHVRAVGDALASGGLAAGRGAVAHIVGRNPDTLDEPAVIRAAIESLAENFSDGVVAPAVWGAVAGLPGMAAYKAVNTADSMIGHRTARHAEFGWAAARLDDLLNLPASRLAAIWLVLAALLLPGADARGAVRAIWRDARRHRSPNAGWPEAAMAGALGLRLAGPRIYGAVRVADGWMGDGRAEAMLPDLARALTLYRLACRLQIGAAMLLSVMLRA